MERDWSRDAYARGGYMGVCPPGLLSAHEHALTEPVGCVHWAGTETAATWPGYMEGALEAAERAAAEVCAALGRTQKARL
jgi:monoamine oxidase